jgi:hypothetical protein
MSSATEKTPPAMLNKVNKETNKIEKRSPRGNLAPFGNSKREEATLRSEHNSHRQTRQGGQQVEDFKKLTRSLDEEKVKFLAYILEEDETIRAGPRRQTRLRRPDVPCSETIQNG